MKFGMWLLLVLSLGLFLTLSAAVYRYRVWHRGAAADVQLSRGLLRVPRRYFRDVHDVVSRDGLSAWMHILTAGGFLAWLAGTVVIFLFSDSQTAAAIYPIFGIGCAFAVLAGGLLDLERRRRSPSGRRAAFSKGAWRMLPVTLVAFAIGLIAAFALDPSSGLASIASSAVLVLIAVLTCYFVPFGPLRHGWIGVLNLACHPRPARFEGATETALVPVDLDSQKLGVASTRDLAWNRILNADSCVQCGRCEAACPAFAAGQPLNPKYLINQVLGGLPGLVTKYAGATHPGEENVGPGAPVNDNTLWSCTTCRACVDSCPMFIEHVDVIVDMRRNLTLEKGRFPEKTAEALENFRMTDNRDGKPLAERWQWAQDLELPEINKVDHVQYLLWVGNAGFEAENAAMLRALVKVLRRADVDFAVLGAEELDCGDTARRAGDEATFLRLMRENVATLSKYRFDTILTPDPHVAHCLSREYRTFGHALNVLHHSELLAELIAERRIVTRSKLTPRATFHDPCYLGRYMSVFEAPRRILDASSAEFVEMERSGRNSRCCGGGGGAALADVPGQARIPDLRINDVSQAGADIVVVACPQCATMLSGVTDRAQRVVDLAEVVAETMADS